MCAAAEILRCAQDLVCVCAAAEILRCAQDDDHPAQDDDRPVNGYPLADYGRRGKGVLRAFRARRTVSAAQGLSE